MANTQNLDWQTLVPLIIQYGLPLAEAIWAKTQSNSEPTQADWDELKNLAKQNAKSKLMDSFVRNNVDPESDFAKELLAMVQ